MENLRCVVERITYQNEQNGYSVIKCKAKGYNDIITVVGAMPEVHVGAVLTMTGEWKMDAKFGRQFSMISFEETLPATVYGIEKYLGSGLVKGIGPKFASRIVKEFGAETLNVIEERPDDLIRVAGIGKVRVERIHKSQGSEYPIVVMPILMTHYVMLQRNLVYTGVTRAKKVLVIVGTKKALAMAVRNVTVSKRNTMLAERLHRE